MSPEEEKNKAIEDAKKVIASSESHINPTGWSKTTQAPYYKLKYAKELAGFLEQLKANPERELFFSSKTLGLSPKTLVDRFNQAFKYLIEQCENTLEMDYSKLRHRVEICNVSTGVRIRFKTKTATLGAPELVEPRTHKYKWKEEFEIFIDSAKDGDKFEKKNVALGEEDLTYVRETCDSIPALHVIELSDVHIKIVKQDFTVVSTTNQN